MKVISIEQARAQLASVIEAAQQGPVCLTRHGKPVVVIAGVEGADIEELFREEGDPKFWEAVERVRNSKRPRHSAQAVRNRFGLPPAKKVG